MTSRANSGAAEFRFRGNAAAVLDLGPASTALWSSFATLVGVMRSGNPAWGVPACNGALFHPGKLAGAAVPERMALPDPQFAEILIAPAAGAAGQRPSSAAAAASRRARRPSKRRRWTGVGASRVPWRTSSPVNSP